MATTKAKVTSNVKGLLTHLETIAPFHAKAFIALQASFVRCDSKEVRVEIAELTAHARNATYPQAIAKLGRAAREYFKVDSIQVWVSVGGLMT